MIAEGPPISMIVAGIAFLAIGAFLLVKPRAFLGGYLALLGKTRGIGLRSLTEWELGHLKSRMAVIVTRLFGAFVMLSGAMIFFYAGAR